MVLPLEEKDARQSSSDFFSDLRFFHSGDVSHWRTISPEAMSHQLTFPFEPIETIFLSPSRNATACGLPRFPLNWRINLPVATSHSNRLFPASGASAASNFESAENAKASVNTSTAFSFGRWR